MSDMIEPEESATEQDVSAAARSGGLAQKTRAAILMAAGLLVLPVLYFMVSRVATVHSAPQQGAPTDIATLEARVQASHTIDDRINLSLAYINSGASARAMPLLLSVVAEDHNNILGWNDLCVANTVLKQYDSAIEECKTAVGIDPTYTLARNNLKWARDEKNKSLGIVSGAPGARDASFYLDDGLKHLKLGFYDQAIASWQHTLELDPGSALAVNNIGTAYMMKKQPGEAIVYFNKAIAMDPTLQLAKNNLAWAVSEEKKPTH